jgi:hypothetical protein
MLVLPRSVYRSVPLPHLDRDEQRRILFGHVHHVRVARGHVRGEAVNPRRLPDCRLRYPRTGELPGPRSDSALRPWVRGERMARMKPACAA